MMAEITEKPSLSTIYQKIEAIGVAFAMLRSNPYTPLARESLLRIGHQAALLCKDVHTLANPEEDRWEHNISGSGYHLIAPNETCSCKARHVLSVPVAEEEK